MVTSLSLVEARRLALTAQGFGQTCPRRATVRAGHHDFRDLITALAVIGDTCVFPLADRPGVVLSLVALASDCQELTVRGQHRTPEARPPRYGCAVAGKRIQYLGYGECRADQPHGRCRRSDALKS
jgi:hypothetical protein